MTAAWPEDGVDVTDHVQHASAFFEAHPEIDVLEAFIVDVNGQLRGKWVPVRSAAKVMKGQLRFPSSSFSLDIWGNEVPASGVGAVTGDRDGVCIPVPETLGVVTWTERPMAQVLLSMNNPDGTPFFADPRHVLARVLSRYEARGWTPVVACELEFHLIDRDLEHGRPAPARSPATGRRLSDRNVYCIAELEEFQPVFVDMARTFEAQGIPADTSISEYGVAQYEINLRHVPNGLSAADHCLLMKRAVKGVARKHGLDATFMAKPFPRDSGNGLHVHFSVLDESGRNLFATDDATGECHVPGQRLAQTAAHRRRVHQHGARRQDRGMVVVGTRHLGDSAPVVPLVFLAGRIEHSDGCIESVFPPGFDDRRQVAPRRPLAVDAVRPDVTLQIGQPGDDQPRDPPIVLLAQVLGEVRGVDDEPGIAPRGAVSHPVFVEQENARVRSELPEPAGRREPGDAGPHHHPVGGLISLQRVGRQRFGKHRVPARCMPRVGEKSVPVGHRALARARSVRTELYAPKSRYRRLVETSPGATATWRARLWMQASPPMPHSA